MIVLNYTPHDPLRLFAGEDEILSLPRSGAPIRLEERRQLSGEVVVDGHPFRVFTVAYGEADELPEPEPGTVLLVSQIVCRAYSARSDLLFPADLVRNQMGDIIGCRAFARLSPDDR